MAKSWYRYEAGDRTPHQDPEVEAFIVDYSARLGIERRPISPDEVIKRCVYSMINEGAKLLEHGIAQRSSDIDIVYITGYGFPKDKGGPMYLADRIGLDKMYADVQRLYQEQNNEYWAPSALLARLAKEGGSFSSL